MNNRGGPLPALVGSTLLVAVLATILATDGWMIWIPVSITLAIVSTFGTMTSRR